MKIAPLMWESKLRPGVSTYLVHTGQHYDRQMSELFFEQLGIPRPDIELEVGSGSHAVQTAEIMKRFEPVLLQQRPDIVLVVGDVNSTLACSLTAAKLGIPIAHVEAGLRSFDRSMPEEINRILTDAISDWLFVSEPSGVANLIREGVSKNRIFFVGNVMIDTLLASRQRIEESPVLEHLQLSDHGFAVLTLHRPANVDNLSVLAEVLDAIERIQQEVTVVFPVHPRTKGKLESVLRHTMPNVRYTEPLGYLDFMKLVAHSRFVMTDSGGIQEETSVLGIPCLTLRNNTERPITIEKGTNVLVGLSSKSIISHSLKALNGLERRPCVPELWDGKTSSRIMNVLAC